MRQSLKIFPGLQSTASSIDVDVARYPGHIALTYRVAGNIGALRLPAFGASGRADELWKHTCFEAFIRPVSGDDYFEFNFSPSTRWAAYGFSRTREGMHNTE